MSWVYGFESCYDVTETTKMDKTSRDVWYLLCAKLSGENLELLPNLQRLRQMVSEVTGVMNDLPHEESEGYAEK